MKTKQIKLSETQIKLLEGLNDHSEEKVKVRGKYLIPLRSLVARKYATSSKGFDDYTYGEITKLGQKVWEEQYSPRAILRARIAKAFTKWHREFEKSPNEFEGFYTKFNSTDFGEICAKYLEYLLEDIK